MSGLRYGSRKDRESEVRHSSARSFSRNTAKPNPAWLNHNETSAKLLAMRGHDVDHDLGKIAAQMRRKAQQNDARRRLRRGVDQLPEISVFGHKHPPLLCCQIKNGRVFSAGRSLGDRHDIVPRRAQGPHHPEVAALVSQKQH